jgi:integrase/recombinase XerD
MTRKKQIMLLERGKTYQELFENYIRFCKIQKLADETIKTYFHHHKYFLKFAGENLICEDINQNFMDEYKLYLIEKGLNGVSVNSNTHNISPVIKYGIKTGCIRGKIEFKQVKEEYKLKELYSKEELQILLTKPNIKKCSFSVYRDYAIINMFVGTGIRAKELRSIKIRDIDLDNSLLRLQITKNKRARYIPISITLKNVLTEYLAFRSYKTEDDYLFSNIFGDMMPRTTLQMSITKYCKKRGLNKYSLHLFRHTYCTNYLRLGGSPFILQRIMGHSSMKMVNHYLALNTDDLQKDSDLFNPLEQIFKKRIDK